MQPGLDAQEPEALRPTGPHAAGWDYIGAVTDGRDVAHGWQLGAVCVMSSVSFSPVPRGWEYTLSVRLLGSPTPPARNTIEAACAMFGMPKGWQQEPGNDPSIVLLSVRVP